MFQSGKPLARQLQDLWEPMSPTATPFAIRRWIAVHVVAIIILTVLRFNEGLLDYLPHLVSEFLLLLMLPLLVCPVMILAATANQHLGWPAKLMGYLAEMLLWLVHISVFGALLH